MVILAVTFVTLLQELELVRCQRLRARELGRRVGGREVDLVAVIVAELEDRRLDGEALAARDEAAPVGAAAELAVGHDLQARPPPAARPRRGWRVSWMRRSAGGSGPSPRHAAEGLAQRLGAQQAADVVGAERRAARRRWRPSRATPGACRDGRNFDRRIEFYNCIDQAAARVLDRYRRAPGDAHDHPYASLASRSATAGVLRRADAIVDAAASVFAERGYHGTTTQAIADVLGMRQASLYYYFPSKEAALELVCARGVDGFVESAEAIARRRRHAARKARRADRRAPGAQRRPSATTSRCSSTSAAICPTPAAAASAARAGASSAASSR